MADIERKREVVTRRLGETVVINGNIEITLVQVQLAQNQVRLGINAPRTVSVLRKELLQAVKRENSRAVAQATPAELASRLKQVQRGK